MIIKSYYKGHAENMILFQKEISNAKTEIDMNTMNRDNISTEKRIFTYNYWWNSIDIILVSAPTHLFINLGMYNWYKFMRGTISWNPSPLKKGDSLSNPINTYGCWWLGEARSQGIPVSTPECLNERVEC